MDRRIKKAATALVLLLAFVAGGYMAAAPDVTEQAETPTEPPSVSTEATTDTPTENNTPEPTEATESRTEAPATTEPARSPYQLTAEERDLVERVVMAEAGAEELLGQLAVAQCIRNTCELYGVRPAEVVTDYQYAKARPDPSDLVRAAVDAVFDEGVQVVDPLTIYFYAPARVESPWHEAQEYEVQIGGHRFFKTREESTT